MSGQTDLGTLLGTLQPELRPGRYVFTTVPRVPDGLNIVASIREDEGVSVVVEQSQADDFGLAYDHVAEMITLRVHSSLQAVGLTAAVAHALARAGLSCNVVAGHFHDHLFVPAEHGARAVRILEALADPGG